MRAPVVGQVGEQVGGVVGRHLVEDLAGLLVGQLEQQRRLVRGVELLEGVGGEVVLERVQHGGALVRRELVDELSDVGRMEQLEPGLRDGEAHRGVVRALHVDVLPVDEVGARVLAALGEALADLAEPHAAQDRAARDVDGDDVHVGAHAQQLDVVDADDLAAVGVDQLLVEEGAREVQFVGLQLARSQAAAGHAQHGARLLEAGHVGPRRVEGLAAAADADGRDPRVRVAGRRDHQIVHRAGRRVVDVVVRGCPEACSERTPASPPPRSVDLETHKSLPRGRLRARSRRAILTRPSFSTTYRRGQGLSRLGQNLDPVVPVLPVGVSGRFRATASMYVGASPNEERAVIDAHETYPRARTVSRPRAGGILCRRRGRRGQGAGFRAKTQRTSHGTPT